MTALDQLRKFAADFGVINSPEPEYLMRVKFETTDRTLQCWVHIDVRNTVAVKEFTRLVVSTLHYDTHEWIVFVEPSSRHENSDH